MAKAKQKEQIETSFNLTEAEKVAQRDLASAEEYRNELLQTLAGGEDVQDKLDGIDEEIAQHKVTLKRFAEARAVAAKANTSSAKQARHEKTLAQLADGVLGAEKLAEQCKAVLLVLAELKGHLNLIDDQRAAVAACLRDVAQNAGQGAPSERAAQDIHEQLRIVVERLTLPTAFVFALHDSGLGRRGVHVSDDFLEVRRPMRDTVSDPTEDSRNAIDALHSLAERMAEWSASANGVATEAAA